GRAIALAMAEAGADVAVTFHNSAREAQHTVIDLGGFGVRAVALRCDVTDEKSVKSTLKEVAKELGGLDILVNNAANYETAEFAVNCVAHGMIDLGEKAAAAFMKGMAKQTPMRRNGTGEEIAAAVLFFATAPDFITGQILAVDGGLGL